MRDALARHGWDAELLLNGDVVDATAIRLEPWGTVRLLAPESTDLGL